MVTKIEYRLIDKKKYKLIYTYIITTKSIQLKSTYNYQ